MYKVLRGLVVYSYKYTQKVNTIKVFSNFLPYLFSRDNNFYVSNYELDFIFFNIQQRKLNFRLKLCKLFKVHVRFDTCNLCNIICVLVHLRGLIGQYKLCNNATVRQHQRNNFNSIVFNSYYFLRHIFPGFN